MKELVFYGAEHGIRAMVERLRRWWYVRSNLLEWMVVEEKEGETVL